MIHRMRASTDTVAPTSAISDRHLRQCLEYLRKNRYTFISIRDLANSLAEGRPLPEKCAVFTMDDGFQDQARIAAPIFQEYDCPATIFLITGMLDNTLWPWDDKVAYLLNETQVSRIEVSIGESQLRFELDSFKHRQDARRKIQANVKATLFSQLETILAKLETATNVTLPASAPERYRPMTWDEARNHEKAGLEFGPHTVSHYILSRLDAKSMKTEIIDSWKRLQSELANPSPVFCYPTGRFCDFGPREVKFVRESGFIGAVSTIVAQVRPERLNPYYQYALPRYPLPSSFNEFKLYCSWFEYLREKNLRFWPS